MRFLEIFFSLIGVIGVLGKVPNGAGAAAEVVSSSAGSSGSCDLWLAQSTIDGTGRGIYVGVNLPKDEPIHDAQITISIPSSIVFADNGGEPCLQE